MKWPNDKNFAFAIVDDTDEATLSNVKPVYDLLCELGIRTTKTVWVLPSRDEFSGDTLTSDNYAQFIKELSDKGYEIAFHGAGSGAFSREEVLLSLKMIKQVIGYYPKLYVNHAHNIGNLYWYGKRFSFPFNRLYTLALRALRKKELVSQGDIEGSPCFWGDFAKEHIKYIRNRTFSGLNTIRYDNKMPYRVKKYDKFSNYWFSSSDAYNCRQFAKLLSERNIDKLAKQKGCTIIYTHFAYGFVREDGSVDSDFAHSVTYLAAQNGWFAPAGEILDYMQSQRKEDFYLGRLQGIFLDLIWFAERINRKIFGGE